MQPTKLLYRNVLCKALIHNFKGKKEGRVIGKATALLKWKESQVIIFSLT